MGGEKLIALGEDVKTHYANAFSKIPHFDDLPKDVYTRIKLKDTMKSITIRSYSTPRKYKEAWATLIQEHLDDMTIKL